MQIKSGRGELIFINDPETLMRYYETCISKYNQVAQKRELTNEEEIELNEIMYRCNQIVDNLRQEREEKQLGTSRHM